MHPYFSTDALFPCSIRWRNCQNNDLSLFGAFYTKNTLYRMLITNEFWAFLRFIYEVFVFLEESQAEHRFRLCWIELSQDSPRQLMHFEYQCVSLSRSLSDSPEEMRPNVSLTLQGINDVYIFAPIPVRVLLVPCDQSIYSGNIDHPIKNAKWPSLYTPFLLYICDTFGPQLPLSCFNPKQYLVCQSFYRPEYHGVPKKVIETALFHLETNETRFR